MSVRSPRRMLASLLATVIALTALAVLPPAAAAAATTESPSLRVSPASGSSLSDTGTHEVTNDLTCDNATRRIAYWITSTTYTDRVATYTTTTGNRSTPEALDSGVIAQASPYAEAPVFTQSTTTGIFPVSSSSSGWYKQGDSTVTGLHNVLGAGTYTLAAACTVSNRSQLVGIANADGTTFTYSIVWNTLTVNADGSWSVVDGSAPEAAATTTTLTATLNPGDNTATLSASVASSGAAVAAGTIRFLEGGTSTVGTVSLSANGTASVTTSTLPAGTYSFTASFTPASVDYAASLSEAQTLTVSETTTAATTTVLTATLNDDDTASLSATVTSGDTAVDGGTVEFFDGTTSLGTGTVSAGTATLTTGALASGAHSLTAVYTPASSAYATSTSAATILPVSDAPSEVGTSLALAGVNTAGVQAVDLGAVLYQDGVTATDGEGTVQFYRDGTAIGDPVAVSGATAALTDTDVNFGTSYTYHAVFTPAEGSALDEATSAEVTVLVAATDDDASTPGTNTPASFATEWFAQVQSDPALLAALLGVLVLLSGAGVVGWNLFWRHRRAGIARS